MAPSSTVIVKGYKRASQAALSSTLKYTHHKANDQKDIDLSTFSNRLNTTPGVSQSSSMQNDKTKIDMRVWLPSIDRYD